MNKVWQKIGVAAYWITWPGLWLVLRKSRRTRVLICSRNKIVAVKPWLGNGKWGLPGGGIHRGESSVSALVREVTEETGLRFNKGQLRLRGQRIYKQNGLSFGYSLFSAKVSKLKKLIPQSREMVEVCWLSVDDVNYQNSNCDILNALKIRSKK